MFNLKGSIVALVTPMDSDGDINWESLNDLIEWHISSNTSGLVIVGTTGESATLDISEHVQLIERSVDISNGRIEIIAGTGANSTKEAIYLTSSAKSAGANASLLVTPYYNKPTQEGLYKHYMLIADEVNLPQILYNVPSRTGCDLHNSTVLRLVGHENIVGLKDATGDLSRLNEVLGSLTFEQKENFFFLFR
jgi:4-hydroxy-tetrahydrodipicolinate synthase